jgi:hypothetical protein
MMWPASVSLACRSIIIYMVLGVFRVAMLCFRMILRRLVWRSGSLVVEVGLLGCSSRSICHVLRPTMGGLLQCM